jgi:hypothetical protein
MTFFASGAHKKGGRGMDSLQIHGLRALDLGRILFEEQGYHRITLTK